MTLDDALQTDAVDVLLRLEDSGFDLDVVAGRLRVKPAARLSQRQREAIATDRDALIVLVRHCLALAAAPRHEAA
jgi:hypothetical protein